MQHSPNIITFQPQPGFPTEDINEPNAAMAAFYFEATSDSEAYTSIHQQTLQTLYEVANKALLYADTNPGNNRREYQAFCHGFTMIDYLATLLDSRPFLHISNGAGMQYFYQQHESFADVELAKRFCTWRESHENTMMVLLDTSDRRGETPKQFTARLVGAQAASELLLIAP